jgi:hypothetical protein
MGEKFVFPRNFLSCWLLLSDMVIPETVCVDSEWGQNLPLFLRMGSVQFNPLTYRKGSFFLEEHSNFCYQEEGEWLLNRKCQL